MEQQVISCDQLLGLWKLAVGWQAKFRCCAMKLIFDCCLFSAMSNNWNNFGHMQYSSNKS